jgi:uncharacterized protein
VQNRDNEPLIWPQISYGTTGVAAGGEPVSDGAARVWPSALEVEALLLRDFRNTRPVRSRGPGGLPAARSRLPAPLRQVAYTAALTFPGHEVSPETLAALATGGGGAAAVQPLVAAQYSKHLLLVRAVMDMTWRTQHAQASHARRGYELLTKVAGHAPGAAEAVLRHPSVGLAALAAAAAIRSRYPCAIEVPVVRGVVTLPSAGQVDLSPGPGPGPDGMANVRSTPEGARVIAGRRLVSIPVDTGADAPGWRGLRAWNLLATQPRTAAEEIRAAIRVLTPLQSPPHGQVSTSSREVFGCVGLSPPADHHALALTLAQEVQYAKLGALTDLVTLTRPDNGQRYRAPWCADPQSAGGLLREAYACLGVSGFWRWRRRAEDGAAATRAHWEFSRCREAAAQAAGVLLASGQLTEAGRTVVSDMAATLHAWAGE